MVKKKWRENSLFLLHFQFSIPTGILSGFCSPNWNVIWPGCNSLRYSWRFRCGLVRYLQKLRPRSVRLWSAKRNSRLARYHNSYLFHFIDCRKQCACKRVRNSLAAYWLPRSNELLLRLELSLSQQLFSTMRGLNQQSSFLLNSIPQFFWWLYPAKLPNNKTCHSSNEDKCCRQWWFSPPCIHLFWPRLINSAPLLCLWNLLCGAWNFWVESVLTVVLSSVAGSETARLWSLLCATRLWFFCCRNVVDSPNNNLSVKRQSFVKFLVK